MTPGKAGGLPLFGYYGIAHLVVSEKHIRAAEMGIRNLANRQFQEPHTGARVSRGGHR